jgi:hypothetical protein
MHQFGDVDVGQLNDGIRTLHRELHCLVRSQELD